MTAGAAIDLNDLLVRGGVDPQSAIVLRNRPYERDLAGAMPWIISEKPQLFNSYQSSHGPRLEASMLKARHLVSFLGLAPGSAHFVGIYEIGRSRKLTHAQFWRIPDHITLAKHGMLGFTREKAATRKHIRWFDLSRTELLRHWKGRLVVGWPPPERSWWRRADRNVFPVEAILEESAFEASMPQWDEITVPWASLSILPSKQRAALSQWRGIYYIFDESSGKGYVGSASGAENILGRWLSYAKSGHGGNKLLKGRDSAKLLFSILQRVSPDHPSEDVVRLESTWKARLHTRAPYGLNEN